MLDQIIHSVAVFMHWYLLPNIKIEGLIFCFAFR